MKFDSSMISVLLAAFAPVLVLFLAIVWDRRQRKNTEKPPQSEKLFLPARYSLALRLEKTFEIILTRIFTASILSAFSAVGIFPFASLLGAHAPASFLI